MIHAHPDDEVFAGGALAPWISSLGGTVVLHLATAGEAALGSGYSRRNAREFRLQQLDVSCSKLGIADWRLLNKGKGWIDTGGIPKGGSLSSVSLKVLTEEVVDMVRQVRPSLIIAVGRDGLTNHPDHILIRNAIDQAVGVTQDGSRCHVLGARLRRTHLASAIQQLEKLIPEPVGTGRVVGVGDGTNLLEICAPSSTSARRKAALDAYSDGLGSSDLEMLLKTYHRRGDTLLLRAALDVSGWNNEYFEPLLDERGSDPLLRS
ncbi:MAG: PIG-L family deacetylase [Actinomycetota bacterium]